MATFGVDKMDEPEEIVGLLWYVASKTHDEPPLTSMVVSDYHVAAGWAHFHSIADRDEGISYFLFTEQLQKALHTAFQETGLADEIKSSLAKFLSECVPGFSSDDGDAESKIVAMSDSLIEKILDSIPCFSKTVFDLIGDRISVLAARTIILGSEFSLCIYRC